MPDKRKMQQQAAWEDTPSDNTCPRDRFPWPKHSFPQWFKWHNWNTSSRLWLHSRLVHKEVFYWLNILFHCLPPLHLRSEASGVLFESVSLHQIAGKWTTYQLILHGLFGKYVPPAHISRPSLRLSLCACAVTSAISWEATDAISWNLCYVYVCSCAWNTFKTIQGAADCEIRSLIRFFNARKALPSEIHHQIRQVYGDNAMSVGMVRKWVRMFNEGWENVHDEVQSGSPSLVNDVRSMKECVMTEVSQFLICPCTFLRFQGLFSMTLSVVANITGGRILWGGYTKTCAPLR